MVQICPTPDRPLMNAIFDPSGDQVGIMSGAGLLVSCVVVPVLRFLRKISLLKNPSTTRTKSSFEPSGESVGWARLWVELNRILLPDPSPLMRLTVLYVGPRY